jgi:hypothetical protein
LLRRDATDLMKRACASTIGGTSTGVSCPKVTAVSPYRPT